MLLASRLIVVPALLFLTPLTVTAASRQDLLWGAAAGVPLFVGQLALYAALSTGAITVGAPVISLGSAGVPVLAGWLLGAPLTSHGWAGIAAGLLAVPFLTRPAPAPAAGRHRRDGHRHRPTEPPQPPPTRAAMRSAAIAGAVCGLGFGCFTVLTSRTSTDAGVAPLLAAQWVVLLFAGLNKLRDRKPVPGPGRVWGWVAAAACAELVGDICALYASRTNLALVGPALAAATAVTILLARVFKGERIGVPRLVGLAIAGVSLTLVNAS